LLTHLSQRQTLTVPDLHPNVSTYLNALDAFNRDDLDAVRAYVTDNVVYRIPGRNRVAGEYRGIDGFAEILRRLRDETNGTIALTPTSVLADDANLIARARVTAERAGKHLDTENCYAFRFVDDKVTDGQVFLSDPAQVDDFFA
jgi:ketosteroid isomerase-like protein